VQYLPEAIESVLNQTVQDFEIVVVDDGSTDGTEAMMQARYAQHPQIRYHRRANGGPGASRNTALKLAQGQYFAFLDDDDYFRSDHLASFQQAIEQAQHQVAVYRGFIEWERNGKVVKQQPLADQYKHQPLVHMLAEGGGMYPTSCVIHRTIAEHTHFDETIPVSIDAEYWLRVLCEYPLIILKQYVGVVRLHNGNLTSANPNTYQKYIQVWTRIMHNPDLASKIPLRYIRRYIAANHLYLAFYFLQQEEGAACLRHLGKALRKYPAKVLNWPTFKTAGKAVLLSLRPSKSAY